MVSKEELKNLVTLNNISGAIDLLISTVLETDYENGARLLYSRLREVEQKELLGLLNYNEATTYKNQIKESTLKFIDQVYFVNKLPLNQVQLLKKLEKTDSKLKILFDESHRQESWVGATPTSNIDYKSVLESVFDLANVYINKEHEFSENLLSKFDILIFPTPFGIKINDEEYQAVERWVITGGRILVFGFYLMESHLYLNLNMLTRRLGFEFNTNLIMQKEKATFMNCYLQSHGYLDPNFWLTTEPAGSDPDHFILKDIKKLRFLSSCTIQNLTSFDLQVKTGSPVSIMKANGLKEPDGKIKRIDDYYEDKFQSANFLTALNYGRGKVVGIGSWKIFLSAFINDETLDNKKLFRNILEWLAPIKNNGE